MRDLVQNLNKNFGTRTFSIILRHAVNFKWEKQLASVQTVMMPLKNCSKYTCKSSCFHLLQSNINVFSFVHANSYAHASDKKVH